MAGAVTSLAMFLGSRVRTYNSWKGAFEPTGSISNIKNVIRPLSEVESAMKYYSNVGDGIIVCDLDFTSSVRLEKSTWFDAFDDLIYVYPIMSTTIRSDANGKLFLCSEDTCAQKIVNIVTSLDDLPSIETLFSTQFEEGAPHFQFYVVDFGKSQSVTIGKDVYKYVLRGEFSHAIVDGLSTALLLARLHSFLNKRAKVSEVPNVIPPPIDVMVPYRFLPPVIHEFGQAFVRCSRRLPVPWYHINTRLNDFFSKFPAPLKGNPSHPRKCDISSVVLSAPETQELLFRCRRKKSTVTGTFAIVAALALRRLLDIKKNVSHTVYIDIMVDQRKYMMPKYASLREQAFCGVGMASLAYAVKLKPCGNETEYFWKQSIKISNNIMEGVKSLQILGQWNVGKFLLCNKAGSDRFFKTALNDKVKYGRHSHILLSNIGSMDLDDDSTTVKLDDLCFGGSGNVLGNVFPSFVCTINGRLKWNLVHISHIITSETMEQYKYHLLKVLQEVALGSHN